MYRRWVNVSTFTILWLLYGYYVVHMWCLFFFTGAICSACSRKWVLIWYGYVVHGKVYVLLRNPKPQEQVYIKDTSISYRGVPATGTARSKEVKDPPSCNLHTPFYIMWNLPYRVQVT
jgi:hypothetical protein